MSRICRPVLAIALVLAVAAPPAPAAPRVVQAAGPFTVDGAGPTFMPLPGGRCMLGLTTAFRFPAAPPPSDAPGTLVGAFTAKSRSRT
jgi:hypothetical protein